MNRVRIISIGAIARLSHKGIGALMSTHLMRNLLRQKEYVLAEVSWILERKLSPQNLAKRFHATPGREFVLLEKKI